jgi:hypothetical protein
MRWLLWLTTVASLGLAIANLIVVLRRIPEPLGPHGDHGWFAFSVHEGEIAVTGDVWHSARARMMRTEADVFQGKARQRVVILTDLEREESVVWRKYESGESCYRVALASDVEVMWNALGRATDTLTGLDGRREVAFEFAGVMPRDGELIRGNYSVEMTFPKGQPSVANVHFNGMPAVSVDVTAFDMVEPDASRWAPPCALHTRRMRRLASDRDNADMYNAIRSAMDMEYSFSVHGNWCGGGMGGLDFSRSRLPNEAEMEAKYGTEEWRDMMWGMRGVSHCEHGETTKMLAYSDVAFAVANAWPEIERRCPVACGEDDGNLDRACARHDACATAYHVPGGCLQRCGCNERFIRRVDALTGHTTKRLAIVDAFRSMPCHTVADAEMWECSVWFLDCRLVQAGEATCNWLVTMGRDDLPFAAEDDPLSAITDDRSCTPIP